MRTLQTKTLAVFCALLVAACASDSTVNTIDPADLAARIASGSAPVILDVRTADEFAVGHVPGAINLSHDVLEARIGELRFAKDAEVAVYCVSGRRAGIAEGILRDAGYTGVRDLAGHYKEWAGAGRPVEKTTE